MDYDLIKRLFDDRVESIVNHARSEPGCISRSAEERNSWNFALWPVWKPRKRADVADILGVNFGWQRLGHFARSGSERYSVESGRCAGVGVTSVRANLAAVQPFKSAP